MSETAIMVAIHDEFVRSGKLWIQRNNTGQIGRVRFGLGVGGADLVSLIKGPGRGFAVEVKTPTGRMTNEQECWARGWRAAGGIYACVRSVDEAMAALEEATR